MEWREKWKIEYEAWGEVKKNVNEWTGQGKGWQVHRKGGGKDIGEVCNSLLSPSPAPSPNLPRTINQIRRQTLIEDYHATGSTIYTDPHTLTHTPARQARTHTHTNKRTHNQENGRHACNRIYSQTHRLLCWLERKKFAAHICSLCTDFYQLDCSVNQSHCGSLGSQREVRAHETEQAQREHERRGWRRKERKREKKTNRKQRRARENKTIEKNWNGKRQLYNSLQCLRNVDVQK